MTDTAESYRRRAAELARLDSIGAAIANMPEAKRSDLVVSALGWIALAIDDISQREQQSMGDATVLRALGHATRALLETRKVEG